MFFPNPLRKGAKEAQVAKLKRFGLLSIVAMITVLPAAGAFAQTVTWTVPADYTPDKLFDAAWTANKTFIITGITVITGVGLIVAATKAIRGGGKSTQRR